MNIIEVITAGDLDLWIYEEQKRREVEGNVIRRVIVNDPILSRRCLSRLDLEIIKGEREGFYSLYFEGLVLLALCRQSAEYMYCLYKNKAGQLVSNWHWMGYKLNQCYVVPMIKNQ
ncbi:MAG: hypothetical protein WCW93_03715 [Candidatus Paceibacterota bacterium]